LGVQFGSKWVNVKPHGSKQSQVAPCLDQTVTCQSAHWVSFTLPSNSFVASSTQSSCRLVAFGNLSYGMSRFQPTIAKATSGQVFRFLGNLSRALVAFVGSGPQLWEAPLPTTVKAVPFSLHAQLIGCTLHGTVVHTRCVGFRLHLGGGRFSAGQ
jgi:hypothetical protein